MIGSVCERLAHAVNHFPAVTFAPSQFNDALGGGNVIENNLLWNTCRESGDHGAINSWNRQPFLHDLGPGGKPSFTPLPTTIKDNFIFANYGSSQGTAPRA